MGAVKRSHLPYGGYKLLPLTQALDKVKNIVS
jgi:hypothetical protein